jgi:hypothetical protein
MTIDALTRTVTVTRAELRNLQTYLKVKGRMESGYTVHIPDTRERKPWNALVVTKAELWTTQAYEEAKQRAKAEHRTLWIDD